MNLNLSASYWLLLLPATLLLCQCKSPPASNGGQEQVASAQSPSCAEGVVGDDANCGECGNACTGGAHCVEDRCVSTVDVAMLSESACALQSDGRVACWGNINPQEVERGHAYPIAKLDDAVQLEGRNSTLCVVHDNGTVGCWGSNDFGQLGQSDVGWPKSPVTVPGVTEVTQLAMSGRHVCALRKNGRVVCWGTNLSGELGQKTDSKQSGPVEVPDIPDMAQVSAGWRFSCGRTAGGEVYCWGGNGRGQQGVPDMDEYHNGPHRLAGISGATELASGLSHSCAVVEAGEVKCWGYNDDGFLVAGADRFIAPTTIAGLADVEELEMGNFVTCAVTAQKDMSCWSATRYARQAQDVERLALSSGMGCLLDTSGAVACWGSDFYLLRLFGREMRDVPAAEAVEVAGLPAPSYESVVLERIHPYLLAFRGSLLQAIRSEAIEARLEAIDLRGTIDGSDRELTLMAADYALRVFAPYFLEAAAEGLTQYASTFRSTATDLRALDRLDNAEEVARATAIIDKLRPITRPIIARGMRSGSREDLFSSTGLLAVTKVGDRLDGLFAQAPDKETGSRTLVVEAADIAAATIELKYQPDRVFAQVKELLEVMSSRARQTTAYR